MVMSKKMSFLEWMQEHEVSAEDFATRKADLQAEYLESQKVRGKNQKRRGVVRVVSPDGTVLGELPEMDFREKDAQTAACLWLALNAERLGISLDSEDFSACKVITRVTTVQEIDCGHISDAYRS